MQIEKELGDRGCVGRIEVARRLIAEQEAWSSNQRACDRGPLSLAAGELRRAVVEALAESDLLEAAATIRRDNWATQSAAGIGSIPSNDFSLAFNLNPSSNTFCDSQKYFSWASSLPRRFAASCA